MGPALRLSCQRQGCLAGMATPGHQALNPVPSQLLQPRSSARAPSTWAATCCIRAAPYAAGPGCGELESFRAQSTLLIRVTTVHLSWWHLEILLFSPKPPVLHLRAIILFTMTWKLLQSCAKVPRSRVSCTHAELSAAATKCCCTGCLLFLTQQSTSHTLHTAQYYSHVSAAHRPLHSKCAGASLGALARVYELGPKPQNHSGPEPSQLQPAPWCL